MWISSDNSFKDYSISIQEPFRNNHKNNANAFNEYFVNIDPYLAFQFPARVQSARTKYLHTLTHTQHTHTHAHTHTHTQLPPI